MHIKVGFLFLYIMPINVPRVKFSKIFVPGSETFCFKFVNILKVSTSVTNVPPGHPDFILSQFRAVMDACLEIFTGEYFHPDLSPYAFKYELSEALLEIILFCLFHKLLMINRWAAAAYV